MKKQLLSIILALAMLVNVVAISAAAEETVTLTVSSQSALPGEEVEVTISVSNNTGLASLKLSVAYDSMLTLKGIKFSSLFGDIVTAPEPFQNPEPLTMISPFIDVTANGVFATLTFLVSEDAEYGYKAPVVISFDENDIYDGKYNNVPAKAVDGYVEVKSPEVHSHSYNKQVATEAYKETDATCTKKATYYFSCECGAVGKETFEYGEFAAHSWVGATCSAPEYCSVCGIEGTEANGHTPSDWIIEKAPTVDETGLRYKECTICKERLEEEEIPAVKLNYKVTVNGVAEEYSAGELVTVVIVKRLTYDKDNEIAYVFVSWKAEGVVLEDKSSLEISFVMPENDVVLTSEVIRHGDVNCDSKITASDVLTLLSGIKNGSVDGVQFDVNLDGRVTAADKLALGQIIKGTYNYGN